MLSVAGLFAANTAYVTALTWGGGGGDGSWNNALNWDTAPANGSPLVFDGSSGTTNTNDTALTDVGLVTLQGGSNWTIGGSDLILDTGITNTAGANTWGINTTINAPQAFSVNGGSLTDTGTIAGSSGITVSSTGTGVLTLKGANTFNNGVTLSSGTVQVGVNSVDSSGTSATNITSSAFGTSQYLSLNGGTVMSDGGSARSLYENVTCGASALTLGNATNNGALTFTGAITLANNPTLTISSPVTLSGPIGESGGTRGMTIAAGTSVLTLKGANTFSNGVALSSGTVQVGVDSQDSSGTSATNITSSAFGTSQYLSLNGGAVTLDGGSPRSLYENVTCGAAALTLGNATNNGALTFTGGITLNNNPTLTINSPVTLSGIIGQTGGARGMTIAGTSVLTLKGANTFSNGANVNSSTVTVQIGVDSVGSVGAITSSAFGTSNALSLTAGKVSSDGTSPRTLLETVAFKSAAMTLGDATNNGALDFKGNCTLTSASPTLTINSPVTIEGIIGQSGAPRA